MPKSTVDQWIYIRRDSPLRSSFIHFTSYIELRNTHYTVIKYQCTITPHRALLQQIGVVKDMVIVVSS